MIRDSYVFPGAVNSLDAVLGSYAAKRIFLVRGKKSYILSGAQAQLDPILGSYDVVEFNDFSVNPKLEESAQGYCRFIQANADVILAVGGGSVIDTAKIIKYLLLKKSPERKEVPLIAVPTTAGTGSEATHFAVVYVDGVKNSYADPLLLPSVSLVDACLLKGQSPYQLAVCGFDALAQGVESLWSVHSTEESRGYSKRAIDLLWNHLRDAISGNSKALKAIAEGSYFSGKAINIAKTTAAHACSYGFTSKLGLPHGHAVALFLPYFLWYNTHFDDSDCQDSRGASHIRLMMEVISSIVNARVDLLPGLFLSFYADCGVNTTFSSLEITHEDYLCAIEGVNQDRLSNNPVKVSLERLREGIPSYDG